MYSLYDQGRQILIYTHLKSYLEYLFSLLF